MAWSPDYVTAANLDSYLEIGDSVDDTLLAGWATAASRAVDNWANRQFGQLAAPAARVYRRVPFYNPTTGLWELQIDDLQTLTGFTVNGVAYASSGAILLPDNAPADGVPYTRIGFTVQPVAPGPGVSVFNTLVAQWGWTTTPAAVPMACRLQAARWNFRRGAAAGVAGSPDQGSEVRLLAKLDPDVSVTLAGLARARRPG